MLGVLSTVHPNNLLLLLTNTIIIVASFNTKRDNYLLTLNNWQYFLAEEFCFSDKCFVIFEERLSGV